MMNVQDFLAEPNRREICITLLVNNRTLQAVDYIQCWGECDRRSAIDTVRMLKETNEYHIELVKKKEEKAREKQHRIDTLRSQSLFDDPSYDKSEEKQHQDGKENVKTSRKRCLYLIDGDNHVKEAIKGIASKADNNDEIRVYVSQMGLYNKLVEESLPYTKVIYVESPNKGDQAVDNRIKSELGNAVKSGQYKKRFVISRDQGYRLLLEKYREQYGFTEDDLDLRDVF